MTHDNVCNTMWWPTAQATSRMVPDLAPGTYYWQVKSIEGLKADTDTWWSFTVAGPPEPETTALAPDTGAIGPARDSEPGIEPEAGPADRVPAPVDVRRRESVARRRRGRHKPRPEGAAQSRDGEAVSYRPQRAVRTGLLGLLLLGALALPRPAQAQTGR